MNWSEMSGGVSDSATQRRRFYPHSHWIRKHMEPAVECRLHIRLAVEEFEDLYITADSFRGHPSRGWKGDHLAAIRQAAAILGFYK
jgi:hypothetical protein